MSDFDYFTVLLSFIVSLGVTTLLAAVARLLQESERVVFSWRYALWAAAIFNLQVSFWLKSWSYHDSYVMRVSTVMPPLLLAIAAFLACGLAAPHVRDDGGPVDLRAFHDRQGGKYIVAVAAFMVVAIVQAAAMGDLFPNGLSFPLDALVQASLSGLAVAAAVFRRTVWLQTAVPLVLLIGSLPFYGRLIGW